MLKRIYIDNYKSLVNFELNVGPINLFLGPNGSGKSAVFETLRMIRDFVCGGSRIESIFTPEAKTRWQDSNIQTFELEIEGNEGLYKYELAIEHYEGRKKARIHYERLWLNNKPRLRLEPGGEVHLYRDDDSKGPNYSVDWSLSAVGGIPPRHDNTHLTWFKEQLQRFIIVQVIPSMMLEESPQEDLHPSSYLENFTSWYRYISQDQGMAFQLMSELREVLPGFGHFKFEPFGERHRLLKAYFGNGDGQDLIGYNFGELSDGQKMLIALYSLLCTACADQGYKYILCLDEPENFLALSEIQPWLTTLYDSCTSGQVQALLISHHPEYINYLLASPIGCWFERQSNRPTRVKDISISEKEGLPISELVARGWLNA